MKPDTIQRVDVNTAELDGLTLIEASAGTGKTWTIAGLYLRLILETECTVDQILVVTYTVAATGELRHRIRQRLVEAHAAFTADRCDEKDAFMVKLMQATPDHGAAAKKLIRAIRSFDEAAIFTIHGFCQRVLSERAFESGTPFDMKLISDEQSLVQEVVDDFWRRKLAHGSVMLANYLLDKHLDPDRLMQMIRPWLGKDYLEMRPAGDVAALTAAEAQFDEYYSEAAALWKDCQADIENLLVTFDGFNRKKYQVNNCRKWLQELAGYFAAADTSLLLPEHFDRFTVPGLTRGLKDAQGVLPAHPFFAVCTALEQAQAQLKRALVRELLEEVRAELPQRKRQRKVQAFDDLLLNLNRALEGAGGAHLAEMIRSRYQAALIDEFQDTDPVQYRIFSRIYIGQPLPVFLVGDPKQAIYSFRGADIFAYLEARSRATRQRTLETNWRSTPGLIQAVNSLFELGARPFLFSEIPFYPVNPAEREAKELLEQGRAKAPFHIWHIEREKGSKTVNGTVATNQAAQATAAEIARLLNLGAQGAACIGTKPLAGGDIAVLVRNHKQGKKVKDALLQLGVPCVQQGKDKIFDAREAIELERVLLAISEPGREPYICAALTTSLFGVGPEALYALRQDEQLWTVWLEKFKTYHRLWLEQGFIRMFRQLVTAEAMPVRLLAWPDGERRLTNLLHLGELLQEAAMAERQGIFSLLNWYAAQRQHSEADENEQQLRLESDESLVKIVTIHQSKGLQYPVVFCPFLWHSSDREPEDLAPFACHVQDGGWRAVLDIGSAEREVLKKQRAREALAEDLRLLYVALTRAEYRCYMTWGIIDRRLDSAVAWLLHEPAEASLPEALDALKDTLKAMSDEALRGHLERIAARSGRIHVQAMPLAAGAPYRPPRTEPAALAARPFQGPLPAGWWVTSFTGLTAGLSSEQPDYDAAPAQEADPPAATGIHAFPRGARTGSCWHAIFENLDFATAGEAEVAAVAADKLAQYGFSADQADVVCGMVHKALQAPLDAAGRFRLADVPARRRLVELEFCYPASRCDVGELRRLLHQFYPAGPVHAHIDSLSFATMQGFLKGYIDLVFEHDGQFYIADYKSNWLGAALAAYQPEALPLVMAREAYYLQALLYTLALHRYLRLRVPAYDYATHFGGVYYLFLRGMDPAAAGSGVYFEQPPQALIEALDRYMQGGE